MQLDLFPPDRLPPIVAGLIRLFDFTYPEFEAWWEGAAGKINDDLTTWMLDQGAARAQTNKPVDMLELAHLVITYYMDTEDQRAENIVCDHAHVLFGKGDVEGTIQQIDKLAWGRGWYQKRAGLLMLDCMKELAKTDDPRMVPKSYEMQVQAYDVQPKITLFLLGYALDDGCKPGHQQDGFIVADYVATDTPRDLDPRVKTLGLEISAALKAATEAQTPPPREQVAGLKARLKALENEG